MKLTANDCGVCLTVALPGSGQQTVAIGHI